MDVSAIDLFEDNYQPIVYFSSLHSTPWYEDIYEVAILILNILQLLLLGVILWLVFF